MVSTADLGRWNAELVLGRLYDRRARSNAELARRTGLSRSTVERALDLLAERGLVAKSAPVALPSGRPAALYRLRPEAGCLVAVDVGAHTVRVRVDDLAGPGGAEHEPEPVRVDPADPADKRLAAVDALVDRALAEAGAGAERVRAVTVGTPGIVDAGGTVVACRVIRSGDWVGSRLRSRVAERFPGAAVTVDNDANLAVLGEQRFGVAGGAREIVAVFAGRRVGFGIVHGGRLHRGAHHQAGEAANIRDSWWGRANDWLRGHQDVAPQLFAAAADGQAEALEQTAELGRLLGMAFAEVVHTVDPELIVLGGAVSLAGAAVLDPVAEHFKRACRDTTAPPLVLSTLGRRPVLLGAAESARRTAFTHLLDGHPAGAHPYEPAGTYPYGDGGRRPHPLDADGDGQSTDREREAPYLPDNTPPGSLR
ncbi:ROK family transcriptional regulator [Actinacidiphila bryophytorum]|uniref:ROK family transcriptional regulator n=1 Tax=Actinacidiphila bryophytorum TaxID=1436133 RepID=UPI002176EB7C|nr:ROK family transcriptional regulator [Actinacidiphila bryophytorum]UWE08591.1 ROK family transcriptional regulator [Actinacidiphila bryophytorum]